MSTTEKRENRTRPKRQPREPEYRHVHKRKPARGGEQDEDQPEVDLAANRAMAKLGSRWEFCGDKLVRSMA